MEYVLSYFGKGVGRRRKYLKFVEEGIKIGRRSELVGGGLIRSAGGWSGVLALRRRGERPASDGRILGDGEFVEKVLEEWDEVGKVNLRLNRVRTSLSLLAQQVCENWGGDDGGVEVWEPETIDLEGTGGVCTSGGEGVGVFGSRGGAVPWSDRFLCNEDCR
jgi:hypothetical protein